ncbi:VCBS repeat-containing protein, partial [Candidatus Poribacteria bacterium]|nr:VCBS repeat-containing protein [Candidatus Poribacteria bacterium]
MGAGAAFFDADGDRDMDLFLVNSGVLAAPAGGAVARNALYRNDGNGAFTDVTARSGVGDAGYGMGVAAADYDNDGAVDLYVTNYGSNTLYRNNGDGTFDDVTQAAGVGGH